MLDCATGGLRELLDAAASTGTRAGELANATRTQFSKPWAHPDWDELAREASEKAKLP